MYKFPVLFLTFGAAVFLVQAGIAPPSYHSRDVSVRDILDTAAELLDKLQTVVDAAVDSALNATEQLVDDCVAAADNETQTAKTALEAAAETALTELKKIEADGVKKGVNLSSCLISEAESSASQIVDDTLDEIDTCLKKLLQEAKVIVDNCDIAVNDTTSVISEISSDIKTCKASTILEQSVCGAKIVAEATAQIAAVPVSIAQLVANTTASIAEIKIAITLCSVGKVEEAVQKEVAIVQNVTECAEALES